MGKIMRCNRAEVSASKWLQPFQDGGRDLMPLYEFQCAECDRPFEELVRTSAAIAEVKCPECGSEHVRRKVSLFASKASGGASTTSASSCAPTGT
jgi:putative FmdB family regulatory protein